jgi:hypothetical protein
MPSPRPDLFARLQIYGLDRMERRLSRWIERRAPDECWPVRAKYRSANGYSHIVFARQHGGVHRVAWTLANKREPGELHVCHSCDHPPCCNPAHLFLGTAADNIRDMDSKGRRRNGNRYRTECRNGHPYQANEPPSAAGHHRCGICFRAKEEARNRRRREAKAATRKTRGGEAASSSGQQAHSNDIAHRNGSDTK